MAEHRVFPHGSIDELSDGVWLVRGGLPFPLHRNMVILRLPSGELLLHSVVALDEAGMKTVEALGKLAYNLIPHPAHMRDAAFFQGRHPDLKVITPAASLEAVAKRVPVAGTAEEILPPLHFALHEVPATRVPELIYERPLASGGRMLMVNDAFGGSNATDNSKFTGRLMGGLTAAPANKFGIARIYRATMLRDANPLKRLAGELAKIPDLRLITVSHGDPVTTDCAAALKSIAA